MVDSIGPSFPGVVQPPAVTRAREATAPATTTPPAAAPAAPAGPRDVGAPTANMTGLERVVDVDVESLTIPTPAEIERAEVAYRDQQRTGLAADHAELVKSRKADKEDTKHLRLLKKEKRARTQHASKHAASMRGHGLRFEMMNKGLKVNHKLNVLLAKRTLLGNALQSTDPAAARAAAQLKAEVAAAGMSADQAVSEFRSVAGATFRAEATEASMVEDGGEA